MQEERTLFDIEDDFSELYLIQEKLHYLACHINDMAEIPNSDRPIQDQMAEALYNQKYIATATSMLIDYCNMLTEWEERNEKRINQVTKEIKELTTKGII